MSKTTVNRLLIAWLVVTWGAVALRVDRFPLTWTPMYTTFAPAETIAVKEMQKGHLEKGIRAIHNDGSVRFITRHDLNIPKWNFYRIYYQRMKEQGPNKFRQGNASFTAFDRFWRGLEEGEDNFEADWKRRVLWSVNETLGSRPDDPDFIRRLEVTLYYRRFEIGDLSKNELETYDYAIEWDEAWRAEWDRAVY